MLLNDARGSYGMYSRTGRNTAEKFHILMRKEEILSGNTKKVFIKGQFTPDDYAKVFFFLKENLRITMMMKK